MQLILFVFLYVIDFVKSRYFIFFVDHSALFKILIVVFFLKIPIIIFYAFISVTMLEEALI